MLGTSEKYVPLNDGLKVIIMIERKQIILNKHKRIMGSQVTGGLEIPIPKPAKNRVIHPSKGRVLDDS